MLKQSYRKGDKYILIFTDFNMPKLNGIEACIKMRNFMKDIMTLERAQQPFIVGITAHYHKKYIKQGMKAGMDEIFAKPVTFENFTQMLKLYYFK